LSPKVQHAIQASELASITLSKASSTYFHTYFKQLVVNIPLFVMNFDKILCVLHYY